MLKTAAASNLFSTVIGEKRRGSGSPTTEGSRSVFGCIRPLRLHTHPPLLKGEALSKITLSGIYTNTKALLLGELAACTPERSNTSNAQRDPSVVGEPLPRLFSPNTVEKRFDAAAVVNISPYRTNISPLCSG